MSPCASGQGQGPRRASPRLDRLFAHDRSPCLSARPDRAVMTDIASSPLDTDLCVHVDRRVDPVGHVWESSIVRRASRPGSAQQARRQGRALVCRRRQLVGCARSYHPAEQIRASPGTPATRLRPRWSTCTSSRTVPAPGSTTCVTSTCVPVTTSSPARQVVGRARRPGHPRGLMTSPSVEQAGDHLPSGTRCSRARRRPRHAR